MRYIIFCFGILLLISGKLYSQAAIGWEGSFCQKSEIKFIDKSPAADSWAWDFGDGDISSEQNPLHTYQDTGSFVVSLTITNGGLNSSKLQPIYISLNPKAGFIVDSASVSYSSYTRLFIDTSTFYTAADKFYWDFGDGNSFTSDTIHFQYKYAASGTYTVWHKVTDRNKCVDSISAIVIISDVFYVPNVFTPNNDLINDQFIVTSNGVTIFSIDIYSRWGNLVFHRSGSEQITWDGRLPNGTLVKPGTYFYVITAQNGTVSYEPETGFVTVFY